MFTTQSNAVDAAPADAPRGRPGLLAALDSLPGLPITALVGLLLLRTVLLFGLVGIIRLVSGELSADGLITLNALIMIVDLVTIGVVIMVLRRGGIGLGSVLGRFRPVELLWCLLVVVIVAVGFLIANFTGNLIAYGGPPPIGDPITVPLWVGVLAVPAAVTIGLAEELLYRGVAQDQLTRRAGRVAAWLIVAAFFAIQHIPLALLSGPAVASKLIMTFLAGLLFGGLMIWLRRLWPLVVAHVVIDVIALGLPTLLGALA